VEPIQLLKTIGAVALLGWLCLSPVAAIPQVEPGTVQDIAIPYYAKGQSSPAAVVRIKRVFTDYQRRGFFRIGLLPTLVAEDVKVEVFEPGQVLAALQGAHKWLKPAAAGKALEWRRARFVFTGDKEPRLEAARVHLGEEGIWRLSDGVVFRSGTNEMRQAAASLQIVGSNAGELQLSSQPPRSLNLLQISTNNTIRP
jgi:hypothetical protein